MSDLTPIVLAMDANSDPAGTAVFANDLLELGVEVTLLLTAETAAILSADHPLVDAAKRLDVGLLDLELAESELGVPPHFGPRFEKRHDAVMFPTRRLPSVYVCPSLPLGGYATLSEVNIRAVIAETPTELSGGAFFLGGRLHLSPMIDVEKLVDSSDAERACQRIASEVARTDGRNHVTVRLPSPNAMKSSVLTGFLKRLLDTPSFFVGSVRQAADRMADIPYDHSIPMAAILEMAAHAATGTTTPFKYALGWLSPAEQLHLLVAVWASALEKGRSPRNAQTRTPIPTLEQPVEGTATTISASEFPTVIVGLQSFLVGRNELPTSVSFEGGVVSVQDLLPTLATSLATLPTPADLQIVKGSATFPPELKGLGRLAWTYKPSMP